MTPPATWPAHTTDQTLVDAARSGDRQALELLLRRHHDRIHLLCRRLCRHRQDAEDATQHALIAIVRGLPGFDGRSAFTTWSHRIATNACLDELRRRGRRAVPADPHRDPDGAQRASGSTAGAVGGAAAAPDPAEAVVRGEQRRDLQQALEQLPEEFRLPVVLRDVAEWDYAEIAEHLGLPPGTVRSRIARGRAKLAALLDDPPAGNPAARTDVSPRERP